MKLYLGGKMIGLPGFGFKAFDDAAALLRAMGYEVFNPAEHDRSRGFRAEGLDGTWNEENSQGLDRKQLLMDDFTWIMWHSEGMIALPGWLDSPGARAEVALHQGIYLPVWELGDFLLFGARALRLRPLTSDGKDNATC